MARLPVITEEKADSHTKEVFDAIKSKFGMVPNIFKGMANSSVTLDSYLKLDELISNGVSQLWSRISLGLWSASIIIAVTDWLHIPVVYRDRD